MIDKAFRPVWNENYCECFSDYIPDECDYCTAFDDVIRQIEKKEEKMSVKAKCLVCLKAMKYLWPSIDSVVSTKLGAVDDGNDFIIHGGYGSCHDTEYLKAFICDDCLTSRIELGIIFTPEKGDDHE